MTTISHQPLRLAIVGCGAISELYYCPALLETARHLPLEVVALCDPSPARTDALLKSFPGASVLTTIDDLISSPPDLAVVASPPRFHATQANSLLTAGVHVLCEKPMASSVAEAESMISAACKANRVLAIGLFRRFFPALQTIKALVTEGTLGAVQSFSFEEGGVFNWPAASASFFQKQVSQGGVLLDLGVHILDLISWWFGDPLSLSHEDDNMGNLEANSRISLSFEAGFEGVVRMSRDTPCSNSYLIEFERGRVVWKVGDSNHLDVRLNGLPFDFRAGLLDAGSNASTYSQSFVKQLLNFVSAARGTEQELVPGEEGIRSLRLVEQCYSNKHLIPMPWLSDSEVIKARELAEGLS